MKIDIHLNLKIMRKKYETQKEILKCWSWREVWRCFYRIPTEFRTNSQNIDFSSSVHCTWWMVRSRFNFFFIYRYFIPFFLFTTFLLVCQSSMWNYSNNVQNGKSCTIFSSFIHTVFFIYFFVHRFCFVCARIEIWYEFSYPYTCDHMSYCHASLISLWYAVLP